MRRACLYALSAFRFLPVGCRAGYVSLKFRPKPRIAVAARTDFAECSALS